MVIGRPYLFCLCKHRFWFNGVCPSFFRHASVFIRYRYAFESNQSTPISLRPFRSNQRFCRLCNSNRSQMHFILVLITKKHFRNILRKIIKNKQKMKNEKKFLKNNKNWTKTPKNFSGRPMVTVVNLVGFLSDWMWSPKFQTSSFKRR